MHGRRLRWSRDRAMSLGRRIVRPDDSDGLRHGGTDMDEQELADRAEAEAIARYRAMRESWGAAWGRRPR